MCENIIIVLPVILFIGLSLALCFFSCPVIMLKIIKKLIGINPLYYIAVILLFIVVSAAMLHFWFEYDFLKFIGITGTRSSIEQWGTVGDFFGGLLNPIFAFLAFILLIRTYEAQKEELELTRRELSRSNFEATFFKLIDLHHKMTTLIATDSDALKEIHKNIIKHRDYVFADEIKKINIIQDMNITGVKVMSNGDFNVSGNKVINGRSTTGQYDTIPHDKVDVKKCSIELYSEKTSKNDALNSYIRNFYTIINFLHSSKFTDDIHIRILKSQLSEYEVFFIFYDAACKSELDKNNLHKQQLIDFHFFSMLNKKLLIHVADESIYPSQAYDDVPYVP